MYSNTPHTSVVQSTELPSLSTDRHLVYPLKASFAPSQEGRTLLPTKRLQGAISAFFLYFRLLEIHTRMEDFIQKDL